mmetsp:Transcript_27645/g.70435  ORF Transcript_27645/g.70435 Transcript_27645/m.70435 type:complete len:240 (+) Transcript_27645:217-936(+)
MSFATHQLGSSAQTPRRAEASSNCCIRSISGRVASARFYGRNTGRAVILWQPRLSRMVSQQSPRSWRWRSWTSCGIQTSASFEATSQWARTISFTSSCAPTANSSIACAAKEASARRRLARSLLSSPQPSRTCIRSASCIVISNLRTYCSTRTTDARSATLVWRMLILPLPPPTRPPTRAGSTRSAARRAILLRRSSRGGATTAIRSMCGLLASASLRCSRASSRSTRRRRRTGGTSAP